MSTRGRQPRRRVLPEADDARRSPVRREHAVLFPSGRVADEMCMTESPPRHGPRTWAPSRSTRGRPGGRQRPTRRAAHRPRPVRYRDVRRRRAHRGCRARAVRRAGHPRFRQDQRQARHPRLRAHRAGWTFTDVRHAAIAFAPRARKRRTGSRPRGGRRSAANNVFVDFNQNCRDRTIASAYSLRPAPGRDGLDAGDVGRARDARRPARVHAAHRAWPARLAGRCVGRDRRRRSTRCAPLLELWDDDPVEMPYPPEYPKMPGEPKRVQPSKAKKVVEDT